MVNPVVNIANIDGHVVNCSISTPVSASCTDGSVNLSTILLVNDIIGYSLSLTVDSVSYYTNAQNYTISSISTNKITLNNNFGTQIHLKIISQLCKETTSLIHALVM